MSIDNAPPLSDEQKRMEEFYSWAAPVHGMGTIGWGRNKLGEYHSAFATLAWKAWQEARK